MLRKWFAQNFKIILKTTLHVNWNCKLDAAFHFVFTK